MMSIFHLLENSHKKKNSVQLAHNSEKYPEVCLFFIDKRNETYLSYQNRDAGMTGWEQNGNKSVEEGGLESSESSKVQTSHRKYLILKLSFSRSTGSCLTLS